MLDYDLILSTIPIGDQPDFDFELADVDNNINFTDVLGTNILMLYIIYG